MTYNEQGRPGLRGRKGDIGSIGRPGYGYPGKMGEPGVPGMDGLPGPGGVKVNSIYDCFCKTEQDLCKRLRFEKKGYCLVFVVVFFFCIRF